MLEHGKQRLVSLFRRDPWLIVKFAAVTVALGLVAKAILFGAVEGVSIPPSAAQFVPTIPMMLLTYVAHKYLWRQTEASFRSQVGEHWSKGYGTQFIIGHGLFTLLVGLFGWWYMAVSLVIGATSAVATFIWNELKVFTRQRAKETDVV